MAPSHENKKNILKKFAAELVVGHKTIFTHEIYFYSDVSTEKLFFIRH